MNDPEVLTVLGAAHRLMTAMAGLMTEPTRAICGRCKGKGFDRFTRDRSSRKCPRCRGDGVTSVGSTKR